MAQIAAMSVTCPDNAGFTGDPAYIGKNPQKAPLLATNFDYMPPSSVSFSSPYQNFDLLMISDIQFWYKSCKYQPFEPTFQSWIASFKVTRNNKYCPIEPTNFDCNIVTKIAKSECNALVDLYQSTNGANWLNSVTWLTNNNPCSWEGVSCSSGQVSIITRNKNALKGTLPSSIGNFPGLKKLNLFKNALSGSIPSTIGQLSNLQFLSLGHSDFSGSIPAALGNLNTLTHLDLSSNQLSGSIVSQLGNMGNLKNLYMDNNAFTGTIPVNFANLINIERLFLAKNAALGGSFPPAFATNMQKIKKLTFQSTQICEPSTTEFQAWIGGISVVVSSKPKNLC